MQDKIKDLICRIEQLESDESVEAGIELGKLYGRMKELNWIWNVRIKQWVYDYDNIIDTEEEDPV